MMGNDHLADSLSAARITSARKLRGRFQFKVHVGGTQFNGCNKQAGSILFTEYSLATGYYGFNA